MRYIPKSESFDRRGQGEKLYCIIAGSAVTQRSEQIAQFPLSGRIVSEFETKQIREVIEGSYRIIYYIKSDQIDVLAVLHSSQQIESIIDKT
ncbi:MAG: type II toxin-antitoxin system RelE/ParE family toxin [Nostoc sp.]|uniref:type II toxin-antitoxin system RelE/ParE family toxin n=1 Tax=Nostoc sp. TaxID=1180 RepID=UPI002FF7BF1C